MDQFSKNKFPWYSGDLEDLTVDSDGNLVLKSGKTVGMYHTIVYSSIGTKTAISWESDETNGEINATAGALPKTIEMRTSDEEPIGTTLSIGSTGLVPYIVNNLVSTDDGWMVKISGIAPTNTVYGMSNIKMSIGYPIIRSMLETAALGGGVWTICGGLNITSQKSSTMFGGASIKMSIGLVSTINVIETAAIPCGVLTIEGVYLT